MFKWFTQRPGWFRLQERPGAKDQNDYWIQVKGLLFWSDYSHADNPRRQAMYDAVESWHNLVDALDRVERYKKDRETAKERINEDAGKSWYWSIPLLGWVNLQAVMPYRTSLPYRDKRSKRVLALENYQKEFDALVKEHDLMSRTKTVRQSMNGSNGQRTGYYPDGMIPPNFEFNSPARPDTNVGWRDVNRNNQNNQRKKGQQNQNQ